jgi:hypothetical protein
LISAYHPAANEVQIGCQQQRIFEIALIEDIELRVFIVTALTNQKPLSLIFSLS